MNLLQREAYICKRAYELAGSGLHIEPITVISQIVKEGYPEAADLLDNELVRADLRAICARHWRPDAPPPALPDRTGTAQRRR